MNKEIKETFLNVLIPPFLSISEIFRYYSGIF